MSLRGKTGIWSSMVAAFGRLSLGTKVLLAPAVGMACLVAVAGAAYYGLTQQQQTISRIAELRFVRLQLAIEANTFLQEAQFGLTRMLSAPPVGNPILVKIAGDELRSKIQAAMSTLDLSKQVLLDPAEKEALNATMETLLTYDKVVSEALLSAERNSYANLALRTDSAFELLSWNLATLVGIERKLTNEAFAESARRSRQLTIALAAMIVLSLLAAATVTLIVGRHIRSNVIAIRIAASELIAGNLTRRVTVATDDEIGPTARAFNFLVDELAVKVRQLEEEIAERKMAEQKIRENEERYLQMVDMSPDSILIEREGRIVFANAGTLRLLRAAGVEQVIGKSILEFIPAELREAAEREMQALLTHEKGLQPLRGKVLRLDNTVGHVQLTRAAFMYGGELAIQTIVHDLSQHKHYEKQLRDQALHDALTGLPNRRLLMDRLSHAIALAQRNRTPVFVLFFDLDRFKYVNDTLGHDAGDELLKIMTHRISECIRQSDTLARLGGDEFVLVLPNMMEEPDLSALTRRIMERIREPMMLHGQEVAVSSSIGISAYPRDGEDAISLLKNADTAMYRAKEQGRNGVRRYDAEMHAQVSEHLVMESQLRHALERKEFMLHFQPKVDLKSGKITGAEALIRWQHPELGMVPPVRFIPLAEATGLIIDIGLWVIRTACAQLKAWRDAGLSAPCVSVNLSAEQLILPHLETDIRDALQEFGLEPGALEFEITESMSMRDPERTVALLNRLKAMGVGIAIDDFGTGYSNLAYLKRFPVDRLKLDRSFVSDITQDPEDAILASAIIAMAHGLRLNVVAEGVEDLDQLTQLRSYGCDEMQGFYFSRPVPADAFAELLRTGHRLELPAVPAAALGF